LAIRFPVKAHSWHRLAIAVIFVLMPGCLVRHETHVRPSQAPSPALNASLPELISKIDAQSKAIHTLSAKVDMEPTAGSVYSGVIKEYHDVKGYFLVEAPSHIRVLGLAPVVMTKIFDMTSNGDEFHLYIPPKQKFVVGKNSDHRPAKNALENLRPQHILQALIVPPIDTEREKCFFKEAEEGGRRYYAVYIVEPQPDGNLSLAREVWFDRADLNIVRVQFYDNSTYSEDVHYAGYKDFQGVQYPSHLEIGRPAEDYRLTITIESGTFNQPIAPEKFELTQPPGTQLVDLGAAQPAENPNGQ